MQLDSTAAIVTGVRGLYAPRPTPSGTAWRSQTPSVRARLGVAPTRCDLPATTDVRLVQGLRLDARCRVPGRRTVPSHWWPGGPPRPPRTSHMPGGGLSTVTSLARRMSFKDSRWTSALIPTAPSCVR